MAPLCADPRQLVIVLNPARRRALLQLIGEISLHMIQQLQSSPDQLGLLTPEPSPDVTTENKGQDGLIADSSQYQMPSEAIQESSGEEKNAPRKKNDKTTEKAELIQMAAIEHFTEWKTELTNKLEEIVRVEDTPKIKAERKQRTDDLEQKKLKAPSGAKGTQNTTDATNDVQEDLSSLQNLYLPTITRLTTIPEEDRKEALSCVLLLLLSTGKYPAYSRTLCMYLASSLELSQIFLNEEEIEIAKSLMETSTADKKQQDAMSAEAEAAKRRENNKFGRYWKVGLASVAGAAVIGVTGGLAAPVVAGAIGGIMGGIGLGGVASFLGIFWMNGALVGALFGAYGGRMTGHMMDVYAKEIEDFAFIPLHGTLDTDEKKPDNDQDTGKKDRDTRRLRVTIGINGWLRDEEDITRPWRVLNTDSEVFGLRFELKTLLTLGTALKDLVSSVAWQTVKAAIIQRTVLAVLSAALWPLTVVSAASNLDTPFSRGSNRSKKAGQLLADALINKVQGERPVTLVGYSLGATAIHACLQSLAQRHAFGLIETVVIIGAPAPSTPSHWRILRTVVSGKIFNVYSENDMVLGYVYRMHSLAFGVAGLQPIEDVEDIENLNLSDKVSGHLRYPELTGEILRQCGFVGISAGLEIEKDDVIMRKDEQAEGHHNLEISGSASSGDKDTGQEDIRDIAMGVRSLHVGEEAPQSENPKLPPRRVSEAADNEAYPELPQRRADSDVSFAQIQHPRRRPVAPDVHLVDETEHPPIVMMENDSD